MSGFLNARDVADAQDAGRYTYSSFRKMPTQTTGAGVWFDLSMSPGNPAPNYFIGSPNVFVPMAQSTDGGLRHGGNVGTKKHLRKLMALSTVTTPISGRLLDYLGFYGFVDESVTDEQFMDNTVGLTRYADGKGVQLMKLEDNERLLALTTFDGQRLQVEGKTRLGRPASLVLNGDHLDRHRHHRARKGHLLERIVRVEGLEGVAG